MRFMAMVTPDKNTEAGVLPSKELLAEMGKFNEEMMKAGVMLAGEGLHASSKGARIPFAGTKRTGTDGPFPETKDLLAGRWLVPVRPEQEAIESASRVPFADGVVEVRQVFEASDFPPEIFPPEDAAREQAWREEQQRKAAKP